MARKLTIAALVLPLFAATIAVVWSGLNWPPLLWILEYGLPGSQGPTGRVAVVEGVDFVEVSAGYFRMGSDFLLGRPEWGHAPSSVPTAGDLVGRLRAPVRLAWGSVPEPSNEMPVRWVRIPRPLWAARTELSWLQLMCLVGEFDLPWAEVSRDCPALAQHWNEAAEICRKLSDRSGIPVRLPSEAEWECLARAGSREEYGAGQTEENLADFAWIQAGDAPSFDALSLVFTRPVATRRANRWGFHDMQGNLAEWCEDGVDTTNITPRWVDWNGPFGLGQDDGHALRGGAGADPAWACRLARRWGMPGWKSSPGIGVRPVFTLTPEQEHLIEPYLVEGK